MAYIGKVVFKLVFPAVRCKIAIARALCSPFGTLLELNVEDRKKKKKRPREGEEGGGGGYQR